MKPDDSVKGLFIYTDGSCMGNPGKGGYATLVYDDKGRKICSVSKGFRRTTNNRMEICGVLQGLQLADYLIKHLFANVSSVHVISDSRYVIKCTTEYMANWIANDWRLASGFAPKNSDLWHAVSDTMDAIPCDISVEKVKAHAGHEQNEICDTMAKNAATHDCDNIDEAYEAED